jgi:hypothetical protein
MNHAGDRRLVAFLALSLALHALWLALPLRTKATVEAMMRTPLNIRLTTVVPEKKSAVATRHLPGGPTLPTTSEPAATPTEPVTAQPQPPAAIDLGMAIATARQLARDAVPPSLDKPRIAVTVETAIAKATQADEAVETRGTNGEYVTRSRKMRCVTPIYVPHFLEGKTMLTQCEALKG